jgi:hypothetical protein
MLTEILLALAQLLPGILGQYGVSPKLDNLIESGISALGAIFAAIRAGGNVDAVLTALQAALAAVEADTSLDPKVLDETAELIRVLKSAIAAYQQAMVVEDVSTLTPLPLVE